MLTIHYPQTLEAKTCRNQNLIPNLFQLSALKIRAEPIRLTWIYVDLSSSRRKKNNLKNNLILSNYKLVFPNDSPVGYHLAQPVGFSALDNRSDKEYQYFGHQQV